MTNTESISERLKTTFVPLTDVWSYSPNQDRKEWDGQYERVDGETRPVNRNAYFRLRLVIRVLYGVCMEFGMAIQLIFRGLKGCGAD